MQHDSFLMIIFFYTSPISVSSVSHVVNLVEPQRFLQHLTNVCRYVH